MKSGKLDFCKNPKGRIGVNGHNLQGDRCIDPKTGSERVSDTAVTQHIVYQIKKSTKNS